jgi:hypothetical protein
LHHVDDYELTAIDELKEKANRGERLERCSSRKWRGKLRSARNCLVSGSPPRHLLPTIQILKHPVISSLAKYVNALLSKDSQTEEYNPIVPDILGAVERSTSAGSGLGFETFLCHCQSLIMEGAADSTSIPCSSWLSPLPIQTW